MAIFYLNIYSGLPFYKPSISLLYNTCAWHEFLLSLFFLKSVSFIYYIYSVFIIFSFPSMPGGYRVSACQYKRWNIRGFNPQTRTWGGQINQCCIKVIKNLPLKQLLYCIHHVVVNLTWKNLNITLQVQHSLLAVLGIKFCLYVSLKLYPTGLCTYKPCLYNMASTVY